MKNKVVGVVGILWGSAIITSVFSGQLTFQADVQQQSQLSACFFAALMVVVGTYYLIWAPETSIEE